LIVHVILLALQTRSSQEGNIFMAFGNVFARVLYLQDRPRYVGEQILQDCLYLTLGLRSWGRSTIKIAYRWHGDHTSDSTEYQSGSRHHPSPSSGTHFPIDAPRTRELSGGLSVTNLALATRDGGHVAEKAQEAPVPRTGSTQSQMLPRIRRLPKGATGA
jgi:hypothetical protein